MTGIGIVHGDLLSAGSDALVNPVNCVGAMGKGLALQFRRAFPENHAAYADACRRRLVRPGRMFVFATGHARPRFVINFPTKRHWRDASRMDDIDAGLEDLRRTVRDRRITSIAVPALGSGLGGLDWEIVKELIQRRLGDMPHIRIDLFAPHGAGREYPLRGGTMPDRTYAGIGSRETPAATLTDMTGLAGTLAEAGWRLASGGADGADRAFADGAPVDRRTVWLPWHGYNGLSGPDCRLLDRDNLQACMETAARLHPAWHRCSRGARLLHARNAAILLGPDLGSPVDAVICWTPGGRTAGGTGMSIRIADERGIPVFNLATMPAPHIAAELERMGDPDTPEAEAGDDLFSLPSP